MYNGGNIRKGGGNCHNKLLQSLQKFGAEQPIDYTRTR